MPHSGSHACEMQTPLHYPPSSLPPPGGEGEDEDGTTENVGTKEKARGAKYKQEIRTSEGEDEDGPTEDMGMK
jgi:hypothetical protein